MSKNPPNSFEQVIQRHPLYVYRHRHLFIDVESYSVVVLNRCGAYRYWDDDSAEIISLAYAYDHEPVQVYQTIKGEEPPEQFFKDLVDPDVIKHAWNANFERLAFKSHYGIYCDPEQFRCSMVLATTVGMPAKLEFAASVLDMEFQKKDGKAFINFFCKPCKPTKKNGGRTRNLPEHDRMLWRDGMIYNKRDVETERGIWERLQKYDQPRIWESWAMDQRINDRGVTVDMVLIDQAIRINAIVKDALIKEAVELTGLDNPASVKQLLSWLNKSVAEATEREQKINDPDYKLDRVGDEDIRFNNLRKKTVQELLNSDTLTDKMRRVLRLRQLMSKSSVSKYEAMRRSVCRDGRIRGLLQFYGAARTGRWAGRIVQVQNLPQNHLKDIEMIREIVKAGNLKMLRLMFGDGILSVLSELIRTAFIPAPGKRLIIADFSAIEARLAAWDSQEEWRMEVFRTHGYIYEESAAQMFKVTWQSCMKGGVNEYLRGRGKVTELALGYQGGWRALVAMGALDNGVEMAELDPMVKKWRQASPKLVQGWYDTNYDAIKAVKLESTVQRERYGFEYKGSSLFQILPSGRKLCYPGARLEKDEAFKWLGVVFDGLNQYTHQWGDIRTYGGKFFENRTQANGVEILTESLHDLENMLGPQGVDIVFSVHDEPVLEAPLDWEAELYAPDHESKAERKKSRGVKIVERIMCLPKRGYKGLPLKADGMDAMVYQK